MRIKNISMFNFRQFKGENFITFDSEKENSITVIHGENGSGKTTILEAFLWCFYGNDELKTKNKEYLLNKVVFSNLNESENSEVIVTVDFLHENKFYRITRSCKILKKNQNEEKKNRSQLKMYKKDINGEFKIIAEQNTEVNNIINLIFPKELSEYFFFDGERMIKLAKNKGAGQKDLANSVCKILGIEKLVDINRFLEQAKKELQSELDYKDEKKIKEIVEKIESIKNNINKKQEILKNYEIDKLEFEKTRDEQIEILTRNKNEQEIIKKIEEYNEEKKVEENHQIEIFDDFINQNNSKYDMIFGFQLIENSIRILEKTYETAKNKDMIIDLKSLNKILDSSKCICGTLINNDSQARRKLLDLKEFLQENDALYEVENLLEQLKNKFNMGALKVEDRIAEYKKTINVINEKDEDIDRLKRTNSEKMIKDINKACNLIGKHDSEIEELIKKITSIAIEIDNLNEKINELGIEKDKLLTKNDNNKELEYRIQLVEELIEVANSSKQKSEKIAKKVIEESFSEIFNEILSKKYKACLKDNYEIEIKDSKDYSVDPSEGEMQIASICFVSALVKLMKDSERSQKLRMKYGYLESEIYPLVMDSPFGQLDNGHKYNLSNELLKLSPQMIILVSSSQWENGVKESINKNVDNEYDLVYQGINDDEYSEYTVIKGVERI